MAVATHGASHADPTAHAWERVRINRLGLWLFLFSDAALFALFFFRDLGEHDRNWLKLAPKATS